MIGRPTPSRRSSRPLHALRPEPPIAALLPCEDEQQAAREYLARAERDIIPLLAAAEAGRLREMFEFYLSDSGGAAEPRVVLHADLSRDHILMDRNSVTGVIDFGDVNWGEADYDFMYLFTDFGVDFAEKVARRYGHGEIDRLRAPTADSLADFFGKSCWRGARCHLLSLGARKSMKTW